MSGDGGLLHPGERPAAFVQSLPAGWQAICGHCGDQWLLTTRRDARAVVQRHLVDRHDAAIAGESIVVPGAAQARR